ncbi:MAG TPA: hypothetical protein VGT04_07045 [Acidobacteriaceae bacterium]|nr:hypothetical protein [Acidobacteriaceae bacterium]
MSNAAGEAEIVLKANTASYSAGIEKARRQLNQFGVESVRVGHATVAPWMASSAAIRVLEGNVTNNIRAAERFVATLPGVQTALLKAFPVVGAVALGGVLMKLGKDVYDFVEKTEQMPKAIRTAFQSMNDQGRLANDTLRLTDDRLANQIALLEGKPQNNLAIALDQDRLMADKLSDSLQRVNDQVARVLKANSNGPLEQLLGKGTTAGVEGMISYYTQRLSDLGEQQSDAEHAGDKAAAVRIRKLISDTIAAARRDAQKELAQRSALQAGMSSLAGAGPQGALASYLVGDQSSNIALAQGFDRRLAYLSEGIAEQQRNLQLESQRQKDEDAKEQAAKRKELARQAAEAQRQADAKQMQAFEDGLAAMKNAHEISVGEEYGYWANKLAAVRSGSENYSRIMREMGTLYQQVLKSQDALVKSYVDNNLIAPTPLLNAQGVPVPLPQPTKSLSTDLSLSSNFTRFEQPQNKAAVKYLKNLNDGVAIQKQNADALAESSIQMQVATGQMSKLDAAQAMAALHAQQYAENLKSLQDAIAAVMSAPELSPIERSAKASGLQNQISALNGSRAIEQVQDLAKIDDSTLGGSIHRALDLYVSEAQDAAAQISRILTDAFESVNDSLSHSLMAHAYNGREYRRGIEQGLSNTARGIGSQVLNAGFHQIEGSVLGKFGFGPKSKPDGTASNPIYVRLASGQLAGSGAGASSLLSLVQSSASPSSGLSTVSPILSTLISALPGFAAGGPIPSNLPSIIGEEGPELFIPSSAGRIVPNHDLFGASGDTHLHTTIDARGASDPADVEARVHRAMSAWAPKIVAASKNSVREERLRRPSTATR